MNQLAIVTGATKGIGRACVENFASEGLDIVACSRSIDDLEGLKKDVESSYDVNVHVKPVDVSIKKEVINFGEFVKSLNQSIAVLVNNAGVFIPGSVHEEEDGMLEKMVETNLYSAYHLSRSLVPVMKRQKNGHIFNMCSIASIKAYENGGSYSISKFAMLGMSKNLREELKEFGIRVTAVMPGATYTASWEGFDIDPNRLMKPEDVANSVLSAYKMSKGTVVEDIVLRPQLGDL
ncbi:SDR family NAD(P)-dependent oxidoreductase [Mangrovivirga sp. M17]|uniref:SDR family NAD(P)-dependent oxidoreductase n=1 Tax=Mangrovivirga halotolerans TaxID=2993936 RepID=A0ABT3RVH8_9BACT|nr:SDR family oxidoreductase [Mangrovivirga halotolerans]MCX2745778.1 SDR family NAD(P)-dependent oxidoreductase [Mangrovivirga halotolerans]